VPQKGLGAHHLNSLTHIIIGNVMALTASQLKSLHGQPRLNVLEKSDCDSLTIRVTTKETISFYLRFRV
jgi:hypothetical protein